MADIKINVFQIRLIAIITMAVDHIGAFLYPELLFLRVIGRISFPLFAWLIANGAIHTRNEKMYLLRLLVLAFVSQIPFYLITGQTDIFHQDLNIFFTLFLGLLAIVLVRKTNNRYIQVLTITFISMTAFLIRSDYSSSGIFSIVAFYFTSGHFLLMLLSQFLIFSFLPFLYYYLGLLQGYADNTGMLIPVATVLALPIIHFHNGIEGKKTKAFFYFFYPLHLSIIYLVKVFLF